MAAIFQLRRGTTAEKPTLASGELYMNTTSESLHLGIDGAGDEIILAKLNDTNIGNFLIGGNLTVGGTITAPIITSIEGRFATIGSQSGSWGGGANISQLNNFTQSTNIWTQSIDSKWSTLGTQSGSWITEAETASFFVSVGATLNTLSFTRGDGVIENVTVNTGSAVNISALNSFTQSILGTNVWTESINTKFALYDSVSSSWGTGGSTDITALNIFTGSANSRLNNLELDSASQDSRLDNLELFTGSTASRLNAIESVSGSWITESETGSFLTSLNGTISGSSQLTASYDLRYELQGRGIVSGSEQITAFGFISSSTIQTSGSTIYSTSPGTSNFSTTNGIFIGQNAGNGATYADSSVILGDYAGYTATNAPNAVMIGPSAGFNSPGINTTVAIGSQAAKDSSGGGNSVFIGDRAGLSSIYAGNSINIGTEAGRESDTSGWTVFIGNQAGYQTKNSNYSILIGYQTGKKITGNGIGANNIIIGKNITLENDRKDSINIGGLIFATGSYTTSTGNSYSGSANGKVGINISLPQAALHVSGAAILTNTFTASLSEGYTWVGGAGNVTTLVATSSFGGGGGSTDISALNTFTSSANSRFTNIELFTASANSRLNAIENVSGTWVTEAETASFFTNASVNLNTITFTKGNGTTQNITVDTGSLPAGLVSGSSQVSYLGITDVPQNIISGAAQITPLLPTGTVSGSAQVVGILSSLNSYTQSNDTTNTNQNNRLTEIENYTSSLKNAIGLNGTNVTVFGDLTVNGTTTQINSTQVNIGENILELNYGGSAATAGIYTKDATGGSTVSGSLLWDSNTDLWIAGKKGSEAKILTDGMGVISGSGQLGDYETTGRGIISSSAQITAFGFVSGSYVTTSSFNNYTASISTASLVSRLDAIESTTSSLNTYTSSANSRFTNIELFTASANSRLNSIESVSGSWVTSNITGSSLVTASAALNVITFTKGNNDTFNITIDTGSFGLPAGVVSGSSQLTASYDTRYELQGSSIVSGATQITPLLPTGTVSGSSQVLGGSGVWSGSAQLPTGVVSGSSQVSYLGLSNIPAGIISGSEQLPAGLVSGSSQVVGILSSLNSYTQSNDTTNTNQNNRLTSLESATSSLFTSASLALVTASVSGQTLTFTKGNGSTFDILIPTASFFTSSISVSGSITVSGSIANANYIDFNTASAVPAWKSGRVFWDNTDGALAVYNAEADITLQVGQENWTRIYNDTGASILNGQPVRITGTHGDVPKGVLAKSMAVSGAVNLVNQILGIATHTIEAGTFGYVTTQGLVRGLNTNAFNDGDTLFVGTGSAGVLQNTVPIAPYEIIPIGQVVKASPGASGIIYVAVQQPLDFSDLSSTEVIGTYSDGDMWQYTGTGVNGVWKHKTVAEIGLTTTSSFNAYTSSTNSRLNNLEAFTSSHSGAPAGTISSSAQISSLGFISSSSGAGMIAPYVQSGFPTSPVTGSLVVAPSVSAPYPVSVFVFVGAPHGTNNDGWLELQAYT